MPTIPAGQIPKGPCATCRQPLGPVRIEVGGVAWCSVECYEATNSPIAVDGIRNCARRFVTQALTYWKQETTEER